MQLLVQQLSPERSNHGFGIQTLKTPSYVLQAYRPETGVQFFVTADLKTENLSTFLVRVATKLFRSGSNLSAITNIGQPCVIASVRPELENIGTD